MIDIPGMPAASHLPGRGPLMWKLLLHLHVNQKSDDDELDPKFQNIGINVWKWSKQSTEVEKKLNSTVVV